MCSIRDISITLGPPGSPALKRQIEEASHRTGKPVRTVSFEIYQKALEGTFEPPQHEQSSADKILSAILSEPLSVTGVAFTTYYEKGMQYPVVILFPDKIIRTDGSPVRADFTDQTLPGMIADAFGYLFQANWVRVSVCYAH